MSEESNRQEIDKPVRAGAVVCPGGEFSIQVREARLDVAETGGSIGAIPANISGRATGAGVEI